ncbi:MAG: anhydro-N-acetylmuramic acid kinase [Bacilli bacterium]|nr:anhydro-N-acetylmuramic acid kinase [Bacilli bacterium]
MLKKLQKKKVLYAVGLMSGTSLDGVDAALVKINNKKNPTFEMVEFESISYPESLKQKVLKNSSPDSSNIQEICSLNVELSNAYVEAVKKVLEKACFDLEKLDFIANHGQTVWHNSNNLGGHASSTLQLGDASTISAAFNKLVIYDFRTLDMAYGGSGAPLIPMSEFMIFRNKDISRVLLNIGGIGNITYMPKNAKIDEVFAFDTGPGNMLIDASCMKLFSKPYDASGLIGRSGKVCDEILDELMDDEYFKMQPPKSTGREKYSKEFLNKVIEKAKEYNLKDEDIVSTLTAFTAKSIINQVETFVEDFNDGELVVSGGGANNPYILDLLKKYKTKNYKVITGFDLGINADAKEAVGFVVLGYLRIMNKASNVIKVTGAKKAVSLGSMVLPQEN